MKIIVISSALFRIKKEKERQEKKESPSGSSSSVFCKIGLQLGKVPIHDMRAWQWRKDGGKRWNMN